MRAGRPAQQEVLSASAEPLRRLSGSAAMGEPPPRPFLCAANCSKSHGRVELVFGTYLLRSKSPVTRSCGLNSHCFCRWC